jgi:hypothetical protein
VRGQLLRQEGGDGHGPTRAIGLEAADLDLPSDLGQSLCDLDLPLEVEPDHLEPGDLGEALTGWARAVVEALHPDHQAGVQADAEGKRLG